MPSRFTLVPLLIGLTLVAQPCARGQAQATAKTTATNALLAAALEEVKLLPAQPQMPDPLLDRAGKRITDPKVWAEHRTEMKRVIEHFLTGTPPPPPKNVRATELDSQTLLDGTVNFQSVRLWFGPQQKLWFEAAIFFPAKMPGPFPVIVQPSFSATPGSLSMPREPEVSADGRTNLAIRNLRTAVLNSQPAKAAEGYKEALNRGYAVMTFFYQQCGQDNPDFRNTEFIAAYPDSDWGDLAAWAWAMSRCVDYLETQPFADTNRFIALGHSRLGKATLMAGAMDERFALVAPAGSGCAGTGAFRFNGKTRGGKEGLEDVVARFPQWISPRLGAFSGQVEKLPFDQHWLIALVAPRAFIAADALDDGACNGKALKQSYLAAKPVFQFLGVEDRLGIHYRPGKHALAAEDWKVILDFADAKLKGLPATRKFDELPPDEQLH